MGIREILAAIELIGRHQRPLLHFVKDILHVDEFTFAEIHVHTGPHKLLDQHRQIEAVRIETAEVASLDKLGQRLGDLRKKRAILHVFVRNAVNGRSFGRNRHSRIDPPRTDDLLAVGHNLDHRYFDDAVPCDVDAGRFQIEENDRPLEVELHPGYALIIIGISSMSVALDCLSS